MQKLLALLVCPEGSTLINCNRVVVVLVLLVVVWLCRRNYQKRNTTMRLKAVAAPTPQELPLYKVRRHQRQASE